MANTKSTQHEIDLTGSLNLNKFKADIKPYEGFNERNAPYYGGCLSPLYIKDDGEVNEYTKYVDGVKWETRDGKLYKNDEEVMSFYTTRFIRTNLTKNTNLDGRKIVNFLDKNNYIEQLGTSTDIYYNGTKTSAPSALTYEDSCYYEDGFLAVLFTDQGNRSKVYYSTPNNELKNFTILKNTKDITFFCGGKINGKHFIQINMSFFYVEEDRFIQVLVEDSSNNYCIIGYDGISQYKVTQHQDGSDFIYTVYDTVLYTVLANNNVTNFMLPLTVISKGYKGSCVISISKTGTTGTWTFNFSNVGIETFEGKDYLHVEKNPIHSDYNGLPEIKTYVNEDMLSINCSDVAFCKLSIKTGNLHSYINSEFITVPGAIFHNQNYYYRVISDNTGYKVGISYSTNSEQIGTLLVPWGSIGQKINNYGNNGIVYFDNDDNSWVMINQEWPGNDFVLIDDYVVINTTSYYNCYNISTRTKCHWASDLYNNVIGYENSLIGRPSNPGESTLISTGQNINWENNYPSSIKAGSAIIYGYQPGQMLLSTLITDRDDNNLINVYVENKYTTSITQKSSVQLNKVNEVLVNTTYPSDSTRYNLPLLFNARQGVLDTTIVNFGSNVSFFTIYYDNRQRYQYYSSSITEFEDFFVIQAQSYGIKNNKIYSIAYSGGTIQASQAVVSIEGLQFVGNTIYNAYFYSPTTKAIYSFGADNNLVVFAQADTFDGITGSSYLPGTSSIILGTPDCAYVLNEKFGIYRLNDIKNLRYASQKPDSVVLVLDDHAYEISYIDRDITEDWEKIDIICDTAFYGAGSNVVSVNDCWYIRITDSDHKAGEIKLAVSTLTDIGRSTETRTFKVKESDWDELTDTIYIRFQPKLQRAVGVSLHIESPFKIGYIGVGATPETLQLNKGTI